MLKSRKYWRNNRQADLGVQKREFIEFCGLAAEERGALMINLRRRWHLNLPFMDRI